MSSCAGRTRAAASGAVIGSDPVREPADHGDRPAGELALDQLGGGRDLVGDGGDRHVEPVAVRVQLTAQVLERSEAGDADRLVDEPVAPRPAQGVADHDGHVDAEYVRPARRAARAPTRRGRGAAGRTVPGSVLLASTPAAASTSPCRVSTMRVGPRCATTRTVSDVIASSRSIRGNAALCLGHRLRGDDHDVAVPQRPVGRRGLDQRRKIVAGRDLGQPVRRPDLECRSTGVPHLLGEGERLAGHGGRCAQIGHEQRHSTCGDAGRLDDRAPRRRQRCRPASRPGAPSRSAARPPRPRSRRRWRRGPCRPCPAPAFPRRWVTARRPVRRTSPGPRGCRHGQHHADAHDRVARRQHDDVGAGDGIEHARARRWPRRPRPGRSSGRSVRRAAAPSTPGSAPPAGRRAPPGRR